MLLRDEKEKAIALRRLGKTYSEILAEVPVAKSTLAIWLGSVGLTVPQKQYISELRRAAQRRGAAARRSMRKDLQNRIYTASRMEVGRLSTRELWLIGIALYWAEGSKEKEYSPGSGVKFSNSDPAMIRLFLRWLRECVFIDRERIRCEIYIHETHAHRKDEVKRFWSESVGLPLSHFRGCYLKRNKINTKRRNTGVLYNGLLRVTISSSSTLNRMIVGWVQGISEHCGIV